MSLFAAGDPDPDAVGVVLARLDAALGEGRALRARVVDGPSSPLGSAETRGQG